jgi:uroporphyrinogen decarboxylase
MKGSFEGFHVVSFESRRAAEMEKLIRYYGGVPVSAPSMREAPLKEAEVALGFADRLANGGYDIVIFLTGVGTRALAEAVSSRLSKEALADALRKTTVVARGPKPVAALRELGVKSTLTVPEPNTWRDLITVLEGTIDLRGKRVALQEYGATNPDLISALADRGAQVTAVPVYVWSLPEDLKPLRDAISLIAGGQVEVALFTSAQQVRNVFRVASDDGTRDDLLRGLRRTVIGSIGPTTSETLAGEFGIRPDYEPDSPKMGNLVREVARNAKELLRKKRLAADSGVDTLSWKRIDMVWLKDGGEASGDRRRDSLFLKACRREATPYTPIWIMRQAGRFLREYREIREKVPFSSLCKTPELAAEVTLMAVERLGVDAAIIFSDILLILEPLGISLEYSKGDGPLISTPLCSSESVSQLREFDAESLAFVYDAVRIARRALPPEKALIGFAGAPFTLASYAIEGGGSKNYLKTKSLMYFDPGAWHMLMEKLAVATAEYLNAQIAAGADAVQLFDSWVGCLSPDDYDEYVKPHMKGLFQRISPGVPVIHFGTGTSSLLPSMKEAGGDVIGLDWRVKLDEAWERLGFDVAVQGNLDPVLLLAPQPVLRAQAARIMDRAGGRGGHIFNLGHGVLPQTPVDNVLALVDFVHEYSSKSKDFPKTDYRLKE